MLMLNTAETRRAELVLFDPESAQSRLEAQVEVNKLLDEGFTLDDQSSANGQWRLIPPRRPMGRSVMRILSQNGDDRLLWDRNRAAEVKEAYKEFTKLIGKGYKAFCVMANGQKGHQLDDFDPFAEEILMVPATVPG